MSKAFTRESDNDDDPLPARPSSALPSGAKNYMTPDGAERLRAELLQLIQEERPSLSMANHGDPDLAKRKLQHLDQRIQQLEESLQTAVITPPPDDPADRDRVAFGATVTVRRKSGEITYRIVGVDEADPEQGWVSWASPIARALLQARVGDRVRFRFPSGEEELEVLTVSYGAQTEA
jgi:transcription elongation factor GreB